jgi:hypothetical protein
MGASPQALTADETVAVILDEFEDLTKKFRKNQGRIDRRKL